MELSYLVLLRPSEIRFTSNYIQNTFDNNISLKETLTQLQLGEVRLDDIPFIEVIWSQKQWEWFTLNNRRLWVFQQLEKHGLCKLIKTRRLEKSVDHPAIIYGSTCLRDESPRKVTFVPPADWTSNCKEERSYKYSEVTRRVSVERQFVNADLTIGYHRYEETHKYSGLKSRRTRTNLRDLRKRSRRSPPFKSSSLARLKPSRRHCDRNHQAYPSSALKPCDQVYGVVTYDYWRKKRNAFLEQLYKLRSDCMEDPRRLIRVLFTCGVCYKSFETRVSLEQHSEELMHFSCVRCGKFFTSTTALGQHKLALSHFMKIGTISEAKLFAPCLYGRGRLM